MTAFNTFEKNSVDDLVFRAQALNARGYDTPEVDKALSVLMTRDMSRVMVDIYQGEALAWVEKIEAREAENNSRDREFGIVARRTEGDYESWTHYIWVKACSKADAQSRCRGLFHLPSGFDVMPGSAFWETPYCRGWDRRKKAWKFSQYGGLNI